MNYIYWRCWIWNTVWLLNLDEECFLSLDKLKCCRLDRLEQCCCHPLLSSVLWHLFLFLLLLLFYLDHFILRNKFCYLSSLSCIYHLQVTLPCFTLYIVCVSVVWILIVHFVPGFWWFTWSTRMYMSCMCYKHSKHIYCKNSVYFLKYLLTF